jgi:hypothetical protein
MSYSSEDVIFTELPYSTPPELKNLSCAVDGRPPILLTSCPLAYLLPPYDPNFSSLASGTLPAKSRASAQGSLPPSLLGIISGKSYACRSL